MPLAKLTPGLQRKRVLQVKKAGKRAKEIKGIDVLYDSFILTLVTETINISFFAHVFFFQFLYIFTTILMGVNQKHQQHVFADIKMPTQHSHDIYIGAWVGDFWDNKTKQ